MLLFILEITMPILGLIYALLQMPTSLIARKNRYSKDKNKWQLLKKSGKCYVAIAFFTCLSLEILAIYKKIDDNRFSLDPFVSNQTCNINCGGSKISFEIPEGGNVLNSNGFGGTCDSKINGVMVSDNHFIDFKVIKYRIILSFTVRDLKTGVVIAQMTDNKWVTKPNELLCVPKHEKNSVEIVDKYGYVAFQLWQDDNKDIQIRGYSVGSNCTEFFYGNVLDMVDKNDPDYERKIEHFAERLTEKLY